MTHLPQCLVHAPQALETDNFLLCQRDAAAQQLGVAILPEQLAAADARTGLVCTRPIRDDAMTRRHVVAWHKEKYLTASMRRFITLCRSAAEEVEKQ